MSHASNLPFSYKLLSSDLSADDAMQWFSNAATKDLLAQPQIWADHRLSDKIPFALLHRAEAVKELLPDLLQVTSLVSLKTVANVLIHWANQPDALTERGRSEVRDLLRAWLNKAVGPSRFYFLQALTAFEQNQQRPEDLVRWEQSWEAVQLEKALARKQLQAGNIRTRDKGLRALAQTEHPLWASEIMAFIRKHRGEERDLACQVLVRIGAVSTCQELYVKAYLNPAQHYSECQALLGLGDSAIFQILLAFRHHNPWVWMPLDDYPHALRLAGLLGYLLKLAESDPVNVTKTHVEGLTKLLAEQFLILRKFYSQPSLQAFQVWIQSEPTFADLLSRLMVLLNPAHEGKPLPEILSQELRPVPEAIIHAKLKHARFAEAWTCTADQFLVLQPPKGQKPAEIHSWNPFQLKQESVLLLPQGPQLKALCLSADHAWLMAIQNQTEFWLWDFHSHQLQCASLHRLKTPFPSVYCGSVFEGVGVAGSKGLVAWQPESLTEWPEIVPTFLQKNGINGFKTLAPHSLLLAGLLNEWGVWNRAGERVFGQFLPGVYLAEGITYALSNGGQFLAMKAEQGVNVWSLPNFHLVRVIPLTITGFLQSNLCFTPKNHLLIQPSTGLPLVINLNNGEILMRLTSLGQIQKLTFLPSGHLAVADYKHISLWQWPEL